MVHPRGFLTGAKPSPRHVLAAAAPHRAAVPPPPQVAYVPKQLSLWGNDQYGDCVTADEAGAKACNNPEIFITDQTAISWANQHGVLNGADLSTVLDAMVHDGFQQGGSQFNDGPKMAVDWTNEAALQAAIATGPVKIAIDHAALPANAGPPNGWYALGTGQKFTNADHCVGLWGYGPAEWLFQQLGLPCPAALQGKSGYLLFTWGSIGFVDHPWIVSTTVEAWVRNPTTVIVGPTPGPNPSPLPGPTPAPPPPPSQPSFDQAMTAAMNYYGPRPILLYVKRLGNRSRVGSLPFDQAMAWLEQHYPREAALLVQVQQAIDPLLAPHFHAEDDSGPFRPGPHPGPWPWIRPFLPPYQPEPYSPTPYYPPQPYPYYPPPQPYPGW